MCLNLSTCLSALFTSGLSLGSCSGSSLAGTLPLIAAMPVGAGPAAPCPRQVQELHPATQIAAGISEIRLQNLEGWMVGPSQAISASWLFTFPFAFLDRTRL